MKKLITINLSEADKVRFWEKVDRRGPDECWEWTKGCYEGGYGHFHDRNNRDLRAHRVAFVVTNGDTDLLVLHHCNNPPCCNPNHLYAGTQEDNRHKCVAEGRAVDNRGENSGQAKLTESDIREIRRLYANGWLQREIAKEYDISKSQVSVICNNKQWKHI